MRFPVVRSRFSSAVVGHGCRRIFCTSTPAPKDPPLGSSSVASSSSATSTAATASTQSQPNADPSATPPSPPKSAWSSFLMFTIAGSLTGAAATAGYASYAYTLDEVDEKTRVFRASANSRVEDDASTTDKVKAFVRSTAMKVPVKAIDLYLDLRRMVEEYARDFTEPSSEKLLPDLHPMEQHVFTLVLDLNETLLYSDWKRERGWRTFKRPGVDAFLDQLAQLYEIVVYSDQLNMYVDPIVERLDPKQCIRYKLSRAATKYQNGVHYRDLSKLNRDPSRVIYVSAHAIESCLQPENSVQIKPWKPEDMDDTALVDLIPFLEYVARNRPHDIRPVLASYEGRDIAKEFIERSKEHQRRMLGQKQQGRFWRR